MVCKNALTEKNGNIFISDFLLHSIGVGVILFKYRKEDIFNNFILEVFPKINIIFLSNKSYGNLSEFKGKYNLDFDDAYQCRIAEEHGFTIITMDKNFKRIK